MKKPIDLSKVPDDAEVGRTSAMRQSYVAGSGRPKKLGQCPKCGVEMGTVELRKHRCPVTDVRAWLREHSTEATVARFDAGLLPEEELHAGMTDVTFAPLDAEWPRYRKITDQEVREAWNEVVRDGD